MKPLGKSLGAPALFGIVQGFVAASIYFAVKSTLAITFSHSSVSLPLAIL